MLNLLGNWSKFYLKNLFYSIIFVTLVNSYIYHKPTGWKTVKSRIYNIHYMASIHSINHSTEHNTHKKTFSINEVQHDLNFFCAFWWALTSSKFLLVKKKINIGIFNAGRCGLVVNHERLLKSDKNYLIQHSKLFQLYWRWN